MVLGSRTAPADESDARCRIEPLDSDATLRGCTTIHLYATDDGRWLATQRGVDVVGHGDTAAGAAGGYCRKIDGRASE